MKQYCNLFWSEGNQSLKHAANAILIMHTTLLIDRDLSIQLPVAPLPSTKENKRRIKVELKANE